VLPVYVILGDLRKPEIEEELEVVFEVTMREKVAHHVPFGPSSHGSPQPR